MDGCARVRIARERAPRARAVASSQRVERDPTRLARARRLALLAETGCGTITAAILIGHTAGAERFRTDDHFARLAGVAPIPVSSGRSERHRLHRAWSGC